MVQSKAIKNLMARLRRNWRRPEPTHVTWLCGGPWAGQRARLPDTQERLLVITVGQWHGHYTRSGTWMPADERSAH
jgi:hypothetical protein